MPCNPTNPKARDDRYECNPLTNRWIKKKPTKEKTIVKTIVKTKTCNPSNPKARDDRYECNPLTNRWVKKKTTKTKVVLVAPVLVEKRPVRRIQTKTARWSDVCKEMEKSCPMETDLSGDPWCSLDAKDVFYYVRDGKRFCYGVDEIFSIIHLGFTARDTSYEVPPLRFQLPRDSYDRTPFTKDFFTAFKAHLKKHGQTPTQPEVCYFLKHADEFYTDRAIVPFLSQRDPNKVQMSTAIDNFLLRRREIDINMRTDKWFWRPGKTPRSMRQYLFPTR